MEDELILPEDPPASAKPFVHKVRKKRRSNKPKRVRRPDGEGANLTVQLDLECKTYLKEHAARTNRSFSELMNIIIRNSMKKDILSKVGVKVPAIIDQARRLLESYEEHGYIPEDLMVKGWRVNEPDY